MPRNITTAQKHARDFHKSDTLAQTNQMKYDCFFLHGTENTKRLFSQDLKTETKNLGMFFQILYCSLISQWKNLGKKTFGQVGALERYFSKPKISQFWVQISEIW